MGPLGLPETGPVALGCGTLDHGTALLCCSLLLLRAALLCWTVASAEVGVVTLPGGRGANLGDGGGGWSGCAPFREARCSLSAVLILAFLSGAGNGTLSGLGAVQWTNSGLLHVEFVPLRWAKKKDDPR